MYHSMPHLGWAPVNLKVVGILFGATQPLQLHVFMAEDKSVTGVITDMLISLLGGSSQLVSG